MANLMREWIRTVAEKELLDAYHSFEDSEGVLNIHLKKSQRIQILDLDDSVSNLLSAIVSDGTTKIYAIFAQAAADAFSEFYSGGLMSMRGGILIIKSYNLTFIPDAPAAKRLFLEIAHFKFEGLEGSATFGHPTNVSTSEPVKDVLARLQNLITGEKVKDTSDSNVSSPIRSQAGDLDDPLSHAAASLATQDPFSTQANQILRESVSHRASEISNTGPRNSQFISNLVAAANEGRAVRTDFPSKTVPDRHSQRSVPTLASNENISTMTSKLQAKANEKHSSLSVQSSSLKSHGSQNFTDDLQQVHSSLDSNNEKENSKESKSSQPQAAQLSSNEEEKRPSPTEPNLTIAPTIFFDQFQEPDPFARMKRVPRRYVRIPETQQTLLERKDSWFEPSADGHPRYANIPPRVHDDLSGFMDRVTALQSCLNAGLNAGTNESSSEGEGYDLENEDEEGHEVESKVPRSRDSTEHQQSSKAEFIDKFKSTEAPLKDVDDAESVWDENLDDDEPIPWTPSPQRISNPTYHELSEDRVTIQFESGNGSLAGSHSKSPSAQPGASQALPALPGPTETEIGKTKQRLGWRKSIAIPSSSPGIEDELELAVPYAVGDFVEDNIKSKADLAQPSTTQDVPSTAPQKINLVEVERTPHQSLSEKKSTPKVVRRIQLSDTIFSDPIIPATFDETNSHFVTSSTKPNDFQGVNVSQLHRCTHSYSSTNVGGHISDADEEHFEDALAEQQNSPESKTAQNSRFEKLPRSLTAAHSPINEIEDVLDLRNHGAVTPLNGIAQSPPAMPTISPPPRRTPASARDDRILVPTTQNSLDTLKRSLSEHGSFTNAASKNSRLSLAKLASLIREDDSPPKDTKEMARMSRHSFNSRYSVLGANQAESVSSSPVSTKVIPGTRPNVDDAALISNKGIERPSGRDKPSLTEGIPESSKASVQRSFIANEYELGSAANLEAAVESKAPKIAKDLQRPRSVQQEKSPIAEENYLSSSTTSTRSTEQLHDPFYTGPVPNREVENDDQSKYVEPECSYFEKYQSFYPDFEGSQKRFTEALVYIEWLRKGNYPIHQSLYDDFVRVYASEYIPWAREQAARKYPPIPGWEYYDINISRPVYQQGIITTRNLQDALASLDAKQVETFRSVFSKNAKKSQKAAVETPVSSPAPTKASPVNISEQESSQSHVPAVASEGSPKAYISIPEELQAPAGLKESSKESQLPDRETRTDLLERPQVEGSDAVKSPKASQRPRKFVVDLGGSVSSERPSTPEVEIVRVVKQNPIKKPFFETPSQLPAGEQAWQKRRHSEAPLASSSQPIIRNEQKPEARRSIPWSSEKIGRPAEKSSSRMNDITQTRTPSFCLPREASSTAHANNSTSKKRPREASPILGSEKEELPPARNHPKLNTATNLSTSSHCERGSFEATSSPPLKYPRLNSAAKSTTLSRHQADIFEATSSPASIINSAQVATIPKVDHKVKVRTWLYEQQDPRLTSQQELSKKKKPTSFREFIASNKEYIPRNQRNQRKSASVQSMMSTPSSTPGDANGSTGTNMNMQAEPETQAFAFN